MKNYYSIKLQTDDTELDFRNTLPITEILRLFNICIFNHANELGLSHENMEKKSNSFWVFTKLKLTLLKPIYSAENIEIKTWIHKPSLIRFERDCSISRDGEVCALAHTEWCCLDFDTFKPQRADTIYYPEVEITETTKLDHTFTKTTEDLSSKDYAYTYTVHSTDIDVNFHTNNLKYHFIAFNAFTVKELQNIDITEYEMHFVNQSHEGDKIDVYKKLSKTSEGTEFYYVEGKLGDTTIFKTVIKFNPKLK